MLPFEKILDVVVLTKLIQRNWYHTITVSVIYYLVIRGLQYVMKNREPFQLRKALFYWNLFLAIFSVIGFVRFSEVRL
jgi:hypothetical protein